LTGTFVLGGHWLCSFKEKGIYDTTKATETIDLRVFSSVKSSQDRTNKKFSFDVYSSDQSFSMVAESEKEKEDWIRAIGKAIVMSHKKKEDEDERQEEEESEEESSSLDPGPSAAK